MKSSARMQIQNSNYQVVNCSTPANYFHVLRRQLLRDFRKPLIIATPKSLLRSKTTVSSLDDMKEGTKFIRVISEREPNKLVKNDKIRTLIFCTGKVYYDLAQYRESKKFDDVAIVTVEQLAPFPFDRVFEESQKYKNSKIVWCQEEPKNMGYWSHVQPRIITALKGKNQDTNSRNVNYVGRISSASPATGLGSQHKKEEEEFLSRAFEI